MTRPRSHAGSALLLVVILLGVLAAIGAAAVTLSARERINAGAKSRRDLMLACANAGQMKVWAEMAKYGSRYLKSPDFTATETVLADGTRLAPLHYQQSAGTPIQSVVVTYKDPIGAEFALDFTNRSQGLQIQGRGKRAVARCVVPGGLLSPDRVLEVEFAMRVIE